MYILIYIRTYLFLCIYIFFFYFFLYKFNNSARQRQPARGGFPVFRYFQYFLDGFRWRGAGRLSRLLLAILRSLGLV